MQVIKPNSEKQEYNYHATTVFLAGSIEMGTAKNWQLDMEKELSSFDVVVFNPRRDDWDSGWFQEQKNDQFNHQVNWELNNIEEAKIIFFYFAPETKSPITLLELGLSINKPRVVVCCPDGFWRKGNIDIVCARHSVPVYNNLDEAIGALKTMIRAVKK